MKAQNLRTFLVALGATICVTGNASTPEPDTAAIATLKRVAATINEVPSIGSRSVVPMPNVPNGYTATFVSSDCLPVVARNGRIAAPLVNTKVHLYYTLSDNQGNRCDIPSIATTIEGRHKPEANANVKPFVVPALREWMGRQGALALSKNVTIVIDKACHEPLAEVTSTFANDITALLGTKPKIRVGAPKKGCIYLTLSHADTTLGNEGYTLDINQWVSISATSSTGCFWGTRSVLQLLEQSNALPKGVARDYPKYERRGFMLDVGRKFFTIDFLRQYVKFMSYYKLNEFQVHLNDNGFRGFFGDKWDSTYSAFRLESSTYPGLTAKDGHYSKKEFIDLQLLAKQYGVNIVPEIDAPAHTLAFAHFMPEIGSKQFGMDHLDLDNPKTYEFMDALLKEYLEGPNPVFIGNEMHIGTDEYSNKVAEKFRAFTDRYIRYVESFGKRARVWGALTHAKGSTPVKSDNVIMDVWYNGYANPADMIDQGYDVISIPDGLVYIVPAAGYYYDYLNNEWLYNSWEPVQIGKEVFPYGHPKILGGKFAVWNDHVGNGISEKDVHHRVLLSMKVLGQKMWMGNSTDTDFATFKAKAALLSEAPGVNVSGSVRSVSDVAAHYTFDTKKVADESGNKRNGKAGKGVTFASDEGARCASVGSGATIQLPIDEVGYGYTATIRVKRQSNDAGTVLLQSPNATLWLSDPKTGKLGFSRDGYTYTFDYSLPVNSWTTITIQGDSKGTTLWVDGKKMERLEGRIQEFNGGKNKMACIQTLVLPLATIGSSSNTASFLIDDMKVYCRTLAENEIAKQ